jgi:hypothetical protein
MILTSDRRLQLFGLVGGSKTCVNTNASFHANTLRCFKIDDPRSSCDCARAFCDQFPLLAIMMPKQGLLHDTMGLVCAPPEDHCGRLREVIEMVVELSDEHEKLGASTAALGHLEWAKWYLDLAREKFAWSDETAEALYYARLASYTPPEPTADMNHPKLELDRQHFRNVRTANKVLEKIRTSTRRDGANVGGQIALRDAQTSLSRWLIASAPEMD